MTTKNMAIVSLVCGIVGIVGSFIPYVSYVAPLCAIAGIVFGALALKNIKAGNCEGNEKGLATAGLVPVSYTHSPSPRDKRQSRMPSSA